MLYLVKMVQNFLNFMQDFNTISICIRMVIAIVFGGLIGMERGKKQMGAGARTFAFVCLGSCVTIIINEYVRIKANYTIDPARIAAQIINGIGFLGAGSIMVTSNNRVKGITTAASLWISAIIGIAVGSGFIYGALMGFAFAMLAVIFFQRYNDWYARFDRIIELYMEIDPDTGVKQLYDYAHENGFLIRHIHRKRQKPLHPDDLCITIQFDTQGRRDHSSILTSLQLVKEFHYSEEI